MKDILISFALPSLMLVIAFVLLMCGHDGEVKTILSVAAGWLFSSGYARNKATNQRTDALRLKSDEDNA